MYETNTKAIDYVEDKDTSEFYPTPENIIEKMVEGIDFSYGLSILEPSAGSGNILKYIARITNVRHYGNRTYDIDAIEIDSNLRQILKYQFSDDRRNDLRNKQKKIESKYNGTYFEKDWNTKKIKYYNRETGNNEFINDADQFEYSEIETEINNSFFEGGIHIVHDDFLTYENFKKYDLIIMNPPFSNGDRHLLKALEMQQNGGKVVCLLNAETILNPYTPTRKKLVSLLDEYNANIEYINNAFSNAERETDVTVALIKVNIPYNDKTESIYEKFVKAENYTEPEYEDNMEIEPTDFLKQIINRYKVEIKSGIELIKTFERMSPYIKSDFNGSYSIIKLTDESGNNMSINKYVKKVRYKYWKTLLSNPQFIGKLTTKLQKEYQEQVNHFAEYDFSEFNIVSLITDMNSKIKTGIENEIESMYDTLTEEHSWYPECKKNKHLYNGWKTNKAWKIEKKVIVPCYGVFSNWDGSPRTYEAYGKLADIERVLNFFAGDMNIAVDLHSAIDSAFNNGITKNIKCKLFNVTFYKKGTMHIVFTCPELIDRYNIYIAKIRKWLPPSYGTTKYENMTEEEKTVVKEFHNGNEKEYANVLMHSNYYLANPTDKQENVLMIGATN